jgi:hypothetical protein
VLGDSIVESVGPERGGGEEEGATPGGEGQRKEAGPPWPRPSAAEVVRAYRLEHATEAGCLVIQPLDKVQQEVSGPRSERRLCCRLAGPALAILECQVQRRWEDWSTCRCASFIR